VSLSWSTQSSSWWVKACSPGRSCFSTNVAMDEDDHALEHVAGLGEIRRVPRASLGVDIFQNDLAAGLPVIRDEALRLVPREAGIRVLVVVQHVAADLEPDRRRSFDFLAALECEHGVTLRHVSLAP